MFELGQNSDSRGSAHCAFRLAQLLSRPHEGQKSAPYELVSWERDFSDLLRISELGPGDRGEVCKTFIAGSIPAVASEAIP